MDTAIQVIWWIGLIGALVPTAVILKQVAVTLRTLKDIHGLAVMVRNAASGIRQNVAGARKLAGAAEPATLLGEAVLNLGMAARALERRIEAP